MKDIFSKIPLINYFKEYKLAFAYSFSIGILISTIPYVFNFIDNYKTKQFIQKEKQLQIQRKSKECRDINSDYAKFLNLGFPNTANEKFKICMQKYEKL